MKIIEPKKGYPITRSFETMDEIDAYFDADKLTCLICGNEYVGLGNHIHGAHDVSVEEYKSQYGIPWQRGLMGKSRRESQGQMLKARIEQGLLPKSPSPSHIEMLRRIGVERRRPMQKSVRNNLSKTALKTHGRTERWGKKDFEEFLRRISEGRTIKEVGKDKDMPCREVFDGYKRENPAFEKKLIKAWDNVPFDVQARGQKLGKRFKKSVVKLRREGNSWPDIAKRLGVKESAARSTWHRLKNKGELDQY